MKSGGGKKKSKEWVGGKGGREEGVRFTVKDSC